MKKYLSLVLVFAIAQQHTLDARGGGGGHGGGFGGGGSHGGGSRGGSGSHSHAHSSGGGKGGQHSGGNKSGNHNGNNNHHTTNNYYGGGWGAGWGWGVGFMATALVVGSVAASYNNQPVYVVNNTYYQTDGVDKSNCVDTDNGTLCPCSIQDKKGSTINNVWCKKGDPKTSDDKDDDEDSSDDDGDIH